MPSIHVKHHDYRRLDVEQRHPGRGIDITASLSRLHRVYTEDTKLIHESSKNRGGTWERTPAAGVSIAATDQTVPTICCDPWNRLWVGYHNETGPHILMSPDLGATWKTGAETGVTIPTGHRYPRVAWAIEGIYISVWYEPAGSLRVFHPVELVPASGYFTMISIAEFGGVSEQCADLNVDRRNRLMVVSQASSLVHGRGGAFKTWGPPLTLAADERTHPVYHPGMTRCMHAFWHGDALRTQLSLSNQIQVVVTGEPDQQPIVNPPGQVDLTAHYVGVTADQRGWYWLIAQKTAGGTQLWRSQDRGKSWLIV